MTNSKDVNEVTPLQMAAKYGRSSFVQKVLLNVEDTNPADKRGRTPLQEAKVCH